MNDKSRTHGHKEEAYYPHYATPGALFKRFYRRHQQRPVLAPVGSLCAAARAPSQTAENSPRITRRGREKKLERGGPA